MRAGAWCGALVLSALAELARSVELLPVDHHAKAAYFVSDGYVFALNAVIDGDVYFHMNAPATHSWMGIGFGSQMAGSRMIISYVSDDGHNLVNSPRIAHGHIEPTYEEGVVIEGVYNDAYAPFANTLSPKDTLIAHAVCRNCSTWATGSLDMSSKAQPFVFALGPKKHLRNSEPDAHLELHVFHGSFTLDMTLATNSSGDYGRVPPPQIIYDAADGNTTFENYGSSSIFDDNTDQDWSPVVHAVFMCLAFIIVFPLGAVLLRLAGHLRYHVFTQLLGFAFVLIGFGVAIKVSNTYNKSRSFTSTHQVIGLLVFAALFIQAGLGLCHHLIFSGSKTPTIMGQVHRFLGISIVLLAVINGGVGLNFAGDHHYTIAYGIVSAVVLAIFAAVGILVAVWRSKHTYKPESEDSFVPFEDRANVTEPPAAYEMRNGYSYSPQTPMSTSFPFESKWHSAGGDSSGQDRAMEDDDGWAETPSTAGAMFKAKWDSVPLR